MVRRACAASIPVVGFNAILMSEHFGAFLAFGILHAALAISYIQARAHPAFPCHSFVACKQWISCRVHHVYAMQVMPNHVS